MGCGIHSRKAYIVETKIKKEDMAKGDMSNLEHAIMNNINLEHVKIINNNDSVIAIGKYLIDKQFILENTDVNEVNMESIRAELTKHSIPIEVLILKNVILNSQLNIFEFFTQTKTDLRSLEINNITQANNENTESNLISLIERSILLESITFKNLHFTKLNLAILIFEKFKELKNLKELSLSKMLITSSMVVSFPVSLQIIHLENIDIQENDLNILFDLIMNFPALSKLSIINIILQYSNISNIIQHQAIEEVNITNCEINNQIINQISQYINKENNFKKLDLSNNFLTEDAIGSIAHILQINKSMIIKVGNNEISKDDIDKIQDTELRKRVIL